MWTWVRALAGLSILAFLLWQVGTGPFRDGVLAIDRRAVAAALAIGVLTTVCCAWRWQLIAAGLGVRLGLPRAIAAYYQSLFLNTTLPFGVLGDVHRAVRHGLEMGDVRLGVRGVVLERLCGQAVQISLGVIVLLALPSPIRAWMPLIAVALVAVAAAAALLLWTMSRLAPTAPHAIPGHAVAEHAAGAQALPAHAAAGQAAGAHTTLGRAALGDAAPGHTAPGQTAGAHAVPGQLEVGRAGHLRRWLGRAARSTTDALRAGLFSRGAWAGVVFTSAVVLAGQLGLFVIAARSAGATAPLALLVPLTLLALLSMLLPLHVAGWGLREGVAAWAFAAAGLTSTQGVSAAVTYGLLGIVTTAPGAAVLAYGALRRGEAGG